MCMGCVCEGCVWGVRTELVAASRDVDVALRHRAPAGVAVAHGGRTEEEAGAEEEGRERRRRSRSWAPPRAVSGASSASAADGARPRLNPSQCRRPDDLRLRAFRARARVEVSRWRGHQGKLRVRARAKEKY
jgi:hypothetical protein